ncbi:uncharacterized protein LOC118741889 [Rhagoletis pomonella]|uniref:uncharacterized protein LOC118741889 n=1 Tax=Rhagoletis pomonella TaxID=28610 RepID=UPI001781A888|nr:uncharacterized protein LOC118741889 [Rhagoletis pomonella]
MVGRQLEGVPAAVGTYFSPLVIAGKPKMVEEKPRTRSEMSTSFNSIVATVHNKLRNQKIRKLKQPKIPELQTEELSSGVAETSAKNPTIVKPEQVEATPDAKTISPKLTSSLKATSIPQIKALRAHKQQQRMRPNVLKITDYNDPVSQKRILEVRAQKRILEDMLMHNQRLQRDQHAIAMEVQAMREHVRDLGNKLDISLRRLTERPIANSNNLGKSKMFPRPQKFDPMPLRKSVILPTKTTAPQSILKTSYLPTKSANPAAQKAYSLTRNGSSPTRNAASPTRNTGMKH